MLKKIFRTSYLLLLFLLLMNCIVLASDDNSTFSIPYHSYTYDFWTDPVGAPQAYQPYQEIKGKELGIGNFKKPQDVFAWNNKELYIADTGNNRIVILDSQWKVKKIIDSFMNNGEEDTFSQPYGIHVTEEGMLYIADRNNGRIVILDKDGNLSGIIGSPVPDHENLFDEDFNYNPVKVSVDNVGRVYVIADKVYDGIMEFDVGGNFKEFLGAPKVAPNIIDYLWRRFSSKERQKRLELILPTEYSNLDVDESGFIYTTVASGEIKEEEAIRRLNPSGDDVLRREGFSPPIGDYGSSLRDEEGEYILPGSSFIDIISRGDGIYSALDKERGRIFTYEYYGRLLYVVGGEGRSRGNFQSPVALTSLQDYLIVLDDEFNNLTIFIPTEYHNLIHTAVRYYNEGEYQKSAEVWSTVKNMNANFDLAYTGIGKANLRQDNFAAAMSYFKLGQNRDSYSKAYQLYRKEVIRKNIYLYMVIALIVIILLMMRKRIYMKMGEWLTPVMVSGIAWAETAAITSVGKKERDLKTNLKGKLGIFYLNFVRTIDGLRYTSYAIFHPFDAFWDLKHEKRGNIPAATTILILVTITYIIQRQYFGFIFNEFDVSYLNIIFEFVSVLIPFLLWVTVNWSLTTLMNGKGTFKDIYIATAYALSPIIYLGIPATIISNFLTQEEGVLIYAMVTIALLWSLLLIFFGTMTVHQYDTSKNFFLTILVIGGIGFSMFIGILFFNLAEQVIRFITQLYNEIFLRI